MPSPRMIKVTCPQCGAGMRIDRHTSVATCGYCRLSSFVHMPNRPDPRPPPGTANYGHIHVNEKALKTAGIVFALTIAAPILVVVGGVFLVLVFGGVALCVSVNAPARPKPRPAPMPAASALDLGGGEVSAACEKTVACCRVAMSASGQGPSQQRSCEALRVLPDADCVRQLDAFRATAQAMGKSCPP